MAMIRWVVGATVALLLASCTVHVGGSPAKYEVEPLTAQKALGDLNTVDYCSLIEGWKPEPGADEARVATWSGFAGCHVQVRGVEGGSPFEMTIGYLTDASGGSGDADEVVNLPGKLRVDKYESGTPGLCDHELVFADLVSLGVAASTADESDLSQEALCGHVDSVMNHLVQRVRLGRVDRLEFADGSLAEISACDLVTEEEVVGVLGDDVNVEEPVTSHMCTFGTASGVDGPWVYVGFEAREGLSEADYTGAVAGRAAVVVPQEELSTCLVATPHAEWRNSASPGIEETIIEVGGSGDRCGPARELANLIFPRLPEAPE